MINQALKDSYHRIFLLATEPDSSVTDNRDGNTWYIHLRRNLQDWELEELTDLYRLLADYSTNPQHPDNLRWGVSKRGIFTVNHATIT